MKNQYFGDQTDYLKYGILREIAAAIPLGIHWTLTEDDGSADGSRTRYLTAASQWRHYDPLIFDALLERVRAGDRRLRLVEELGFIPEAIQCFDKWESTTQARHTSIEAFLEKLPPSSVVFLDPDNGLEVASTRKDRPAASKYVFLDEVFKFWDAGHSLLIYQHYPRVQRVPYVLQQLARLRPVLAGMQGAALLTSHVAFLACIQLDHRTDIENTFTRVAKRWSPHLAFLNFEGEVSSSGRAVIEERSLQAELPL